MVTEDNNGFIIKRERELRYLTQVEYAARCGLKRSNISHIERGKTKFPGGVRQSTFNKLAKGLDLTPLELSRIINGQSTTSQPERMRTIYERLGFVLPVPVPIFKDFPYRGDPMEQIEEIYLPKGKSTSKNLSGYYCHGSCLAPRINEGDLVVLDPDAPLDAGDIVACSADNKTHLGILKKILDELWLSNSDHSIKLTDCQRVAKVIAVQRYF